MTVWLTKYPFDKFSGKAFNKYLEDVPLEYSVSQPRKGDVVFVSATRPHNRNRIFGIWKIGSCKWAPEQGAFIVTWETKTLRRPVLFRELRQFASLRHSKFIRGRGLRDLHRLTKREATSLINIVREHNPKLRIKLSVAAPILNPPELDRVGTSEGSRTLKKHLCIERSAKASRDKKKLALATKGNLACEICGFDFSKAYKLPSGMRFCECHHRRPLSELKKAKRTRLDDLGIVCSNCHRTIHLLKPMPTLEQFKKFYLRRRQ